ncbi:MAG: L,D-transpeptidase [Planctomycetota bacterium]
MDRSGFSPGLVDGLVGSKTRLALRTFQASTGLKVTGEPDEATRQALGLDTQSALRRIVLSDTDLTLVGPWPKSWREKAEAKFLGYESLAALAAEQGHCSLRLLARLNPGKNLDALKPGDSLIVPNATRPETAIRAASIQVDFARKVVWVLDREGHVVSLFHCSIAADPGNLPGGTCSVATIAMDPAYVFDPVKWPEVKGVDQRLVIPPGPRNPVGLCWIGLSLHGYGIHGTPAPELIGKTGSHGCIRLTNWDALQLAAMVRVGTPVRFVDGSSSASR